MTVSMPVTARGTFSVKLARKPVATWSVSKAMKAKRTKARATDFIAAPAGWMPRQS
jgi:hypothetical protein